MPVFSRPLSKRRLLAWFCMALIVIGLPVGCSVLQYKERELVFSIEPGTASWFRGLPADVQEIDLRGERFGDLQNVHAWWWPGRKDMPSILYLHGSRWNLTGQLFRIEQLHDLGYSVLAIDYRGFGMSKGPLPSERSVYEDARVAWERLVKLQPDPRQRLIYGHSLGGAVAIDLAAELGQAAANDGQPSPARGLIVESTFTTLADVATALAASRTSLPVRWLMSLKFDSVDKIADIHMPVLIVHGASDGYVLPRFSEQLYAVAKQPKQLLMVPGANHNNSMALGKQAYIKALQTLLRADREQAQAPAGTHAHPAS